MSSRSRWSFHKGPLGDRRGTIALHGHLFDNGELDRLGELFTPDIVYDVTDAGMAPLHGIAEILRATAAVVARSPPRSPERS